MEKKESTAINPARHVHATLLSLALLNPIASAWFLYSTQYVYKERANQSGSGQGQEADTQQHAEQSYGWNDLLSESCVWKS